MDRRGFLSSSAAAAFSGCAGEPADQSVVRVAVFPRFVLAPVYLAEELGFYGEESLQVEFHRFAKPLEMLPLLAGGKLDVGFLTPVPGLINAITKGARVRLVATREIVTPGCTTGGAV